MYNSAKVSKRGEDMNINTDKIVSISEANQNFSKTARLADKLGEVYIFKNNKPRYRLEVIEGDDFEIEEKELPPETEEVREKKLARLLGFIKKHRKGLEELLRLSDK